MNSNETTIVLDRLFEAALVPGLWHNVLDQFAGSLGAEGAAVVPRTPQQQALGFPVSQSAAEFMKAYVDDGWYLDDFRGLRAWPTLEQRGGAVLEHDISSEEERARLPYYQEFCRHFGLPWWAAVGFKSEGAPWAVVLYRDTRHGPYERGDVHKLEEIGPHMRRIVSVASQFRQAMDARTIQLEGPTVVALDQFGRVLEATPDAAALLGDYLRIRHRQLFATDRRQDYALQTAIAEALVARTPASQRSQRTVVISRGDQSPLFLDVVALPSVARDVFTRVVAFVVFRTAGSRPRPSVAVLKASFGLTPAECELALLVGAGVSLREAGERLHVTFETARTVLKRVFAKVGVSRQSELVVVLAELAPR